jgi:cysteinyl-tRNA synthetase
MSRPMKVFNNLSRSKEEFSPINPGKVKFYSCGPTTYNFLHVGNARAMVVGDLFARVFRALDYQVTFVRNFTDVDDKIIDRANELGVDPLEHSAKFVNECLKDMESLGMANAAHTPKVSETIDEIIEMIKTLEEKGSAYNADGEVYFHVPSFSDYGKLSKKKLEDLQHGIRVEVDKRKKHPSDFVLWKPAKAGEPAWDSPWGKGRPGWHIECSAMAKKFLGEEIDIHHGGVDLMFPHHENEIAQSEAVNGCCFSRNWCHNEFLNFGKEKMSKSLGNVVTIRSFVETYGGEILRQILLSVHYRSKMDWTEEAITKAAGDLERIHRFTENFAHAKRFHYGNGIDEDFSDVVEKMKSDLANDFNVPGAMAHFFSLIRKVNKEYLDENKKYDSKKMFTANTVKSLENVLSFVKHSTGCVYDDYEAVLEKVNQARKALGSTEGDKKSLTEDEIENLLVERKQARADKNWARSDEIRDQLIEAKVVIKDNPDGSTSWQYS